MSMHKVPLTDVESEGLKKHGLGRNVGKPSQLADAFRQGVKWGQEQEREACAKVAEQMLCKSYLPPSLKIYGALAAGAIRARGDAA